MREAVLVACTNPEIKGFCAGAFGRKLTALVPFEVVSVLLLAAVIGGVFLAKQEPGEPRL